MKALAARLVGLLVAGGGAVMLAAADGNQNMLVGGFLLVGVGVIMVIVGA